MQKKDYVVISLLTLSALAVSFFATYDTYCGWEGCMSQGGFPFPFFTPDGIGGSYFSILGTLVNILLFFVVMYSIVKFWRKGK